MVTFKDVVKQMLQDNEFDKILKTARGKDKQRAKEFYNAVKDLEESNWEEIPEIVLITACNSSAIWKDAFVYQRIIENSFENFSSAELKKIQREIKSILSKREMERK